MSQATIRTFSGGIIDLLDPQPDTIRVRDIARGLALTCRWNGQIKTFFSVAQHSVLMARMFDDPVLKAYALFHDASEAYIGDIVSPLKPFLTGYRDVEDRLLGAILATFGLQLPLPTEIKVADNRLLASEGIQLKAGGDAGINWISRWDVANSHDPYEIEIDPWSWQQAEAEFLLEHLNLENLRKS